MREGRPVDVAELEAEDPVSAHSAGDRVGHRHASVGILRAWEPKKTLDITLVTKALDSEWWQRVKAGAEDAAKANPGVRLAVLAPEREVNIDQQVSILEDQITKKVAALAVAPTGAAELIPVLDRAHAAGIPVIIFDTDINWASKLSFVGSDNRRAGRIAGDYIVKLLGGKGKVAVIRGILGVHTHEDRVAGFRDAIRDAAGNRLRGRAAGQQRTRFGACR